MAAAWYARFFVNSVSCEKTNRSTLFPRNNVECICVAMYFANFFTSSCSSSKVTGDFSLLDGVFLLNRKQKSMGCKNLLHNEVKYIQNHI